MPSPEVRLEPFTAADIPRLIAWADSPAGLVQWAGTSYRFPLTASQVGTELSAAAAAAPSCYIYRIAAIETGEIVGHIELRAVDRQHRNARVSRVLVGAVAWRRRGVARQALTQLIDRAFGPLALHRLELAVFDFNAAAIACYEKLGFRREGLHREAACVGERYWSHWSMALLARDWTARRRTASPPV